jgi:hypothetical protein
MALMINYDAVATREGKWWVVQVKGVGTTQGRSTSEAERMAVDLVVAMREVPAEDVTVNVEFAAPTKLASEVSQAREQTRLAADAQRQAADMSRKAVLKLLAAGLNRRDAAKVMGVAPQRISQLAPRAPREQD